MVLKKKEKKEKLEDFKRSELIHIIKVYNTNNIIKNYHKMKKSDLIESINKHILISDDFKKIQPKINEVKLISVSKYDNLIKEKKKKKKDENKEDNNKNLSNLYKAFGGLKAQILLLQKEKKKYDEDLSYNLKLKDDVYWTQEYNDLIDDIKISKDKLKLINEQLKKFD